IRGARKDRSARRDRLSDLAFLPEFELTEELVFLLLCHRLPAGSLLTLVDIPREDRLEVLEVGRSGNLHIALQPLLGGWKAPPAWQLGGDVDLVPLWVMPGIEQRLEPGKEGIDEVDEIAVA